MVPAAGCVPMLVNLDTDPGEAQLRTLICPPENTQPGPTKGQLEPRCHTQVCLPQPLAHSLALFVWFSTFACEKTTQFAKTGSGQTNKRIMALRRNVYHPAALQLQSAIAIHTGGDPANPHCALGHVQRLQLPRPAR